LAEPLVIDYNDRGGRRRTRLHGRLAPTVLSPTWASKMSETEYAKSRFSTGVTPQRRFRTAAAVCLVATIALAGLLPSADLYGQQSSPEMAAILAEMVARKHEFKADELHQLGVAGLSAVLDELLPETAKVPETDVPDEQVVKLIEQLGDDNYRVRQTAAEGLYQLGPGIQKYLVEATRHTDAEIAWQARRILRKWTQEKSGDKSRYLSAFSVYARTIRDPERLEELTRRTVMAMQQGVSGASTANGSRSLILQQCLIAIAGSRNEQYIDQFTPLLKHRDVRVAVMVTQSVGSSASGNFCPKLLIDALQAKRPEIVSAAIGRTQNCGSGPHKEQVKQLLLSIFQGDNASLKLEATLPLLYAFDYTQARDYLLEQMQKGNREHQYRALSYLGSSRYRGKPADEKLLEAVLPLLQSKDNNIRRMASRTLGVYSGEEVVKNLIPLLVDKYSAIQKDVQKNLLQQSDKKMLRRLVAAAAEEHKDEKVQKAAANLLEELGPEQ